MTQKIDPLKAHKARVAAAERDLLAAREAMRGGAKIHGVPSANLFGDTAFVPRESAKQWVRDARAEVREDMLEQSLAVTKIVAKCARDEARRTAGLQTPAERAEYERAARFCAAVRSNAKNGALYETDPSKCDRDYLQMRKEIDTATGLMKLCKSQGMEFSDVFGPGSLASPSSMAMAEKLLEGGKTRRSAVADDPEDVARAIVRAGAKRRSETEESAPFLRVVRDDEQPLVATPQAILRAAAKARGEAND
jgi:hypothetical protein